MVVTRSINSHLYVIFTCIVYQAIYLATYTIIFSVYMHMCVCVCVCACAHVYSGVSDSLWPFDCTCQATLSMGFFRQE